MTRDRRRLDESLPDEALERIDRTCLEFEAAWKQGKRPSIEQHVSGPPALGPVPEPERSCLLLELLLLDLDYRRRKGEAPEANEYRTRFPQDSQLVDEAFRLSPPAKSGAMRVHCPHCHQTIDVAGDSSLTQIVCSSCGESFSLVPDPTVTYRAAETRTIGHFELLDQVGIGAFGTVWKAHDAALDRTVAIKIPRKGRLSAAETEQFLREARAAAQLKHPTIVGVHEVGREGDTVYIVSDYVRGLTLADWLTGQRFTPRQAAEFCAKIADALEHAHRAGVVHRDLKPGNIMLDAEGQPHIMDFGLAKREAGEVTMTLDGQVLGTPAYMSPEQAAGEAHKVDGRSDVYSLGVILYQLLTGELPFRGNRAMLLHQVLHEEPRPPRKLNHHVPRDLQTICLRAMAKERARRYKTAAEMGDDLRRFLHGEPIKARPVGRVERLWRWCRRKPAAAALIAVSIAAAMGLLVGGVWYNRELETALAETEQERDKALAAEKAAKDSEADTEAFGNFLVSDVLAVARPTGQEGGLGIDVTIRKALDAAAPKVAQTFAGRPRAEAKTRNALGQTYIYLGEAGLAIQQLEEVVRVCRAHFGPDHPNTLAGMNNLAEAYTDAGRLKEALPLLQQTREILKATMGPDDPNTLTAMNNLARAYLDGGRFDDALDLFKEVFQRKRARLGPDHPDTLRGMNNLASAYHAAARLKDALLLDEEAFRLRKAKLGTDHPETMASMNNLASDYEAAGRAEEALMLYEETVKLRKKNLGPDHPHTLLTMHNLAGAYQAAGRLKEALPLYEETLKLKNAKLGPDHPDSLVTMMNLATAYKLAGRLNDALPLFEETYRLMKAKLAPEHPNTLVTMNNLARAYVDAGRMKDALPLFEEGLKLMKRKLGPDHPTTLKVMHNLAAVYMDAGRPKEALPLFEESYRLMKAKLGPEHPDTLTMMQSLGRAYQDQGDFARAEPLLVQALDLRKRKLGAGHADTLASMLGLGSNYLKQRRYAEAEPLLRSGYEGLKAREDGIPVSQRKRLLSEALQRLVELYDAQGKPDHAAEWRKKLEADKPAPQTKEKKQP